MATYLVELPDVPAIGTVAGEKKWLVVADSTTDARAAVRARYDGDPLNALIADSATTVTAVAADTELDEDFSLEVYLRTTTPKTFVVDADEMDGHSFIASAVIVNDGTMAYAANDEVTINGGTNTRPAKFKISTVDGMGNVTAVELIEPGDYTVLPTLAGAATTATVGTGAGLTLTLTAVTGITWAAMLARLVSLLNADADIAGAAVNLKAAGTGNRLLTIAAIADGIGDKTFDIAFKKNGVAFTTWLSTQTEGGIAGAVLTVALPASAPGVPTVTGFKA